MKHLKNLLLSFACFTSTQVFAQGTISQYDIGTYYGAGVDTVDATSGMLGQTFMFPGGYMDTMKIAALSYFSLFEDHAATLSIYANGDPDGTILWTGAIMLPGLNKFYPESYITSMDNPISLWDSLEMDTDVDFDGLSTSVVIDQEFASGNLAFVIEISDVIDSGTTHLPHLFVKGNCFSGFCQPMVSNPYADGHALMGIPLMNLMPEADVAFEISYHNIETAVADNEVKEVSMFPNPATDEVTLTASGYDRYEVYDAVGRLVSNSILANHQVTLDVTDWHAGYYAVRVLSQDNRSFTKQLVVM